MQGEKAFREAVERLSDNDLWLFLHMIIAFWHTFGISNGLRINPQTDLQTVHYRKGPDGHYVRAEVMQQKLDEYLRWLQRYQVNWGSGRYTQVFPMSQVLDQVFQTGPASWEKVVKMLELLQIGLPSTALPGTEMPEPQEEASHG